MGCDAADAQVGHELTGVVALVGAQGFLVRTTERTGHSQCRLALGLACGLADFADHHQAVAVLHDAVPHEAQECSDSWGFLEEPGLVVACGAVGLVGEQLAAEIALCTFRAAA